MSSKMLNTHEEDILKKGIKFSPYPAKINMYQYVQELSAFQRRMRLREFFVDTDSKEETPEWMRVKKKSTFTPTKGRECNLDTYLEQVTTDTLKLLRVNSDANCENLTGKEREALEVLRKEESIVIKPADKGGALVIMDKVDYDEAVLKMLSDGNFYTESKEDLNSGFEKIVDVKINELRTDGYISFKEADSRGVGNVLKMPDVSPL